MPVTKTWVVTASNPRPSHAEINGETVGYNDTFSNGLAFPHDPAGDPAETAGCTCVMSIAGTPSKTSTGIDPVHDQRVQDMLDRTPKDLLNAVDHGQMLGATRKLREVGGDLSKIPERLHGTVDALDKVIQDYGFEYKEPEVVTRGVFDDSGWFNPEEGKTWTDHGYVFTSMDPKEADFFAGRTNAFNEAVGSTSDNWVMQILVPTGTRAFPYPRHDMVIFGRSTSYKITGVDRVHKIVTMEIT